MHCVVAQINFLREQHFNIVRFPLAHDTIYGRVLARINWKGESKYDCGRFSLANGNYAEAPNGVWSMGEGISPGYLWRGGQGGAFVLEALETLVYELAEHGVFVALDMHSLGWDLKNSPLWCPAPDPTHGCRPSPPGSSCRESEDPVSCAFRTKVNASLADTEAPLIATWEMLARKFCSWPSVIMADVFNEVSAVLRLREKCSDSESVL